MRKQDALPSLDLLKAFEAAARRLSFTLAGEDLFLSQSAVSRQIQLLEAQLGVKLFHRRTRALLLTESGQVYYREVTRLLDELRAATSRITAASASTTLTVGASLTFASLWLVPRLLGFQQQHPGIKVHIDADNRIVDLKREKLDVTIRYCTRKLAGKGALRLFGERVAPVCAPSLAAGHSLTSPAQLRDFVLLHFNEPDGKGPWLSWPVWFETHKLGAVAGKGALHFSHYDQLIRAAIDGQGVALGRFPLMNELIKSGKLVMPFKAGRYAHAADARAYWLIESPTARNHSGASAFVQWVKAEAEQGSPS